MGVPRVFDSDPEAQDAFEGKCKDNRECEAYEEWLAPDVHGLQAFEDDNRVAGDHDVRLR